MEALIVDGANVVGSRPDGWWRDRAGAARRLREQLEDADLRYDEVVLVLEGAARPGNPPDESESVRIVHAPGSGDDAIVDEVAREMAKADGSDISAVHSVIVVTADRELQRRVTAVGATTRSPGWLLDRL